MNISTRKIALAGSVGAVALVAVGSLALGVPEAITKASGSFFNNPTIKWGALISALIGTTLGILYLLANKDALKRKVTEYGEVSFVVRNGNPRRYRRGKRRGVTGSGAGGGAAGSGSAEDSRTSLAPNSRMGRASMPRV